MGSQHHHSPGGALLTNLGSEWVTRPGDDLSDPKAPTITLDEFASTPVEELDANMERSLSEFTKLADPAG